MFETITKHVRENSVVRFLLSHLIILLAALLICAVGFRSAFVIVRNDVLDSTMFAMTQAVSSVDNGLTELRTLGMQTARSESIYRLENLRHTDDNYYQNIIRAINEYYQRMLYYSPNWVNNTFIYLNSMDRVIYNRAVYAPDIFSGYLLEWGDDAALWQAVCTDDNRAPFFCKLGGQDIYYGIRGIHHMIAVCFCADRQIPQVLQRDDAAVGGYFSLHLYGEHPLKGDPLYLVQCRKLCGEVVELVEAAV